MSIGRIEMVGGQKEYVRYATLGGWSGGASGVPVGDVQDLSLEENSDNLALTWKDPEDVIFNGEPIAEWAGTKVVRKEGSSPESVEDGVLIADSTVKDQYAVDGLQDTDVVEDVAYNYALFPYTTKNVYTMSDANRMSGALKTLSYDPVLANNTWDQISQASQEGVAKDIWNLGDEKDGYAIVGFDHDDLSDGSGKAGITFAVDDSEKAFTSAWRGAVTTGFANYSYIASRLETFYQTLPEDLNASIKQVRKTYIETLNTTTMVPTAGELDVNLFLFSYTELFGTSPKVVEGEQYEGFPLAWGLIYFTRTPTCVRTTASGVTRYDYVNCVSATGAKATTNTIQTNVRWCRYGFCI